MTDTQEPSLQRGCTEQGRGPSDGGDARVGVHWTVEIECAMGVVMRSPFR